MTEKEEKTIQYTTELLDKIARLKSKVYRLRNMQAVSPRDYVIQADGLFGVPIDKEYTFIMEDLVRRLIDAMEKDISSFVALLPENPEKEEDENDD